MKLLPLFMTACLLAMPFFSASFSFAEPAPAARAAAPHTVDAEPAPIAPARLVGAWEYALASPETGKTYRIQVSAIGEAPEDGYPVLYVLDGDAIFPLVSLAAQGMLMRAAEHQATPLLIVGVGYFGEDRSDEGNTTARADPMRAGLRLLHPAARAEDYTPPSGDYSDTGDRRNVRFGGAEKFHRFLTGALREDIGRRFHIQPKRQALLGHSYGGLFGAYVLFNHPGSFRHYLLASPSLWWNGQRALKDWEKFRASRHPPVGVRLSVGEYEQTAAPYLPERAQRQAVLEARGMVRNVRGLGARLAELPGGKINAVETAVYPRETHATSLMPAINDGLKWLFVCNRAAAGENGLK